MYPLIWATIVVVALVVEFFALRRRLPGDTASEQVWSLMKSLWGRLVLIPGWIWLTYHFFIEPNFLKQLFLVNFVDDILLVSLSILAVLTHWAYKTMLSSD